MRSLADCLGVNNEQFTFLGSMGLLAAVLITLIVSIGVYNVSSAYIAPCAVFETSGEAACLAAPHP